MSSHEQSITLQERFRGCLLAGAAADALAAPVELLAFRDIEHQFGAPSIQSHAPAYDRLGAITDDTQMTLFPAEGLLRSWIYLRNGGTENIWLDLYAGRISSGSGRKIRHLPASHDSSLAWLAGHKICSTSVRPEIPACPWLETTPAQHQSLLRKRCRDGHHHSWPS